MPKDEFSKPLDVTDVLGKAVCEKVRLFYVWMAAACAVVACDGFAPTYWLQLPASTKASILKGGRVVFNGAQTP
jgi:hypothetical protein